MSRSRLRLTSIKTSTEREEEMKSARGFQWLTLAIVVLLGSVLFLRAEQGDATLLNVSYDPTRELYQEYNVAFAKYWKAKTGQDVKINQSHGGSGAQARAVIDG